MATEAHGVIFAEAGLRELNVTQSGRLNRSAVSGNGPVAYGRQQPARGGRVRPYGGDVVEAREKEQGRENDEDEENEQRAEDCSHALPPSASYAVLTGNWSVQSYHQLATNSPLSDNSLL